MKKIIIAAAVALLSTTAWAGERPQVPVMIEGSVDYDGCASVGVVRGLDPHGDGFLAVKSGPGINFRRIDKVYNGQQLYLCGQVGPWIGVVYTASSTLKLVASVRLGRERCHIRVHVSAVGSTISGLKASRVKNGRGKSLQSSANARRGGGAARRYEAASKTDA